METNSKMNLEQEIKEGDDKVDNITITDSTDKVNSMDNIDSTNKISEDTDSEEIEEVIDENSEESEALVNEESKNSEEKKGIFGKRKEKKDKKDIQIEELTDKLKRNMAEFENFRKRTEKEKTKMYEIGAKDIVEIILPVIDNFERGLAAIPEGEKKDSFMEGMEMIYTQLMSTMGEAGVKPIEAVGNQFDPNLHNAVMHVEDEEYGENTVVEEFLKGYTYKETVVRHSMVKVAN